MRLIDGDALIKRLDYCVSQGLGSKIAYMFKDMVDEAPTVDAVPVRHGQWEYVDYGGFGNWHCSHCREICITNGDYDYCPNCGAKMDGERKEE